MPNPLTLAKAAGSFVMAFGPKILTASKTISKAIAEHPINSILTAAMGTAWLGSIVNWMIDHVRHSGGDSGKIVAILNSAIPSKAPWPKDNDRLVVAMKEYAAQGPSQRAAIVAAILAAGYQVSVPEDVLAQLEGVNGLGDQDKYLISQFRKSADKILTGGAVDTEPDIDTAVLRSELIKGALRATGLNVEQFLLVREALTLQTRDFERYQKLRDEFAS
jgi:hypothetical protein